MGCGDAARLSGQAYEDWELDDHAGLDVAAVRPVRDEIRVRVEAFSAGRRVHCRNDGRPSAAFDPGSRFVTVPVSFTLLGRWESRR